MPSIQRSYEDLGVANNERRVFSKLYNKPDPIIVGERHRQFVTCDLFKNSSLEKAWQEPRRHRDNGIECEKTLNWHPRLEKREPYKREDRMTKLGKSYY